MQLYVGTYDSCRCEDTQRGGQKSEQMFWNTTTGAPICVPEAVYASDRCQHRRGSRQCKGRDVPVSDWTIPLLRKRHLNWTDWILSSPAVSSGFRLTRWMPNQH